MDPDSRKRGGDPKMLGEGSDDPALLRTFFPWLSDSDFNDWIKRSYSTGAEDAEIDNSCPPPSREGADRGIGGN